MLPTRKPITIPCPLVICLLLWVSVTPPEFPIMIGGRPPSAEFVCERGNPQQESDNFLLVVWAQLGMHLAVNLHPRNSCIGLFDWCSFE